jgi:hypothetical protein
VSAGMGGPDRNGRQHRILSSKLTKSPRCR